MVKQAEPGKRRENKAELDSDSGSIGQAGCGMRVEMRLLTRLAQGKGRATRVFVSPEQAGAQVYLQHKVFGLGDSLHPSD
jgi:hypothetical protein